MEFNQGSELLEICRAQNMPISRVMKLRETEFSQISEAEVEEKMKKSLDIMRRSAKEPLTDRSCYLHYGFKETGQVIEDEIVAIYDLTT